MKLRKLVSIILFLLIFALPACTLSGFAVKEYKPNKRQRNIEYSPEYPLAGSEENQIFVGLIKMTIVNYTEYHLTVKYVGESGRAGKRRYFRRGNSLVLDTGKKKLRLRAIGSLNRQKKLKDGRIEEFNQYRLSWSGLATIGRAQNVTVMYHGRAARISGQKFTNNDIDNFRRFIKTYSKKHVRL